MASNNNRRHWIVALFLQIGIRVRYLLETILCMVPLFSSSLTAYKSPYRPKNCPEYDYLTHMGFKWIIIITAFAREYWVVYVIWTLTGFLSFLQWCHDALSNRLIAIFEKNGYKEAQREVPIPTYDWKKGNPQEFYDLFVVKPHPVILKNFMGKTALLKELSWDKVLSKYGDEDVFLTKKELDGYPGKLKEVNNSKIYLHNSEKLFNKFPEMKKLFDYARVEPYLKMKAGYEQLFVGKEGTGSPFHHAAVYNMFYMVDGKKQWWFIDPYDTFLGYPSSILGRAANVLMCLWPNEYNVAAFPLFKYCPVYTAVLEPGDVLFNPPYWWHSIKNVTPTSVGCATRWHTDGIVGHTLKTSEEDYNIYRLGTFLFMAGQQSVSFLHGILQTPSPRYDEHTSLRERNNRYVHKQIQIHEEGGIKRFGVTTKF